MAAFDREQRRAQILAVATEVFAEKGYHDARIDDIVVRAGIARGTFYLYFNDKRAIFEELVDRFVLTLGNSIEAIELTEDPALGRAALRSNLLRVVQHFLADPAMSRILLSAAVGLDVEFERRLLAFYGEITDLIERSLGEGRDAGWVRPGAMRVRSFCLVGILKEMIYQLILRRAEYPPDELVDAMLDLLVEGLFTDAFRRAAPSGPSA